MQLVVGNATAMGQIPAPSAVFWFTWKAIYTERCQGFRSVKEASVKTGAVTPAGGL